MTYRQREKLSSPWYGSVNEMVDLLTTMISDSYDREGNKQVKVRFPRQAKGILKKMQYPYEVVDSKGRRFRLEETNKPNEPKVTLIEDEEIFRL